MLTVIFLFNVIPNLPSKNGLAFALRSAKNSIFPTDLLSTGDCSGSVRSTLIAAITSQLPAQRKKKLNRVLFLMESRKTRRNYQFECVRIRNNWWLLPLRHEFGDNQNTTCHLVESLASHLDRWIAFLHHSTKVRPCFRLKSKKINLEIKIDIGEKQFSIVPTLVARPRETQHGGPTREFVYSFWARSLKNVCSGHIFRGIQLFFSISLSFFELICLK